MSDKLIAQSILSQLRACLSTLKDCMTRCPDTEWNESHGDYPFSQVLFHTLFDCDYHLSDNEAEFKQQELHKLHPGIFSDYSAIEELDHVRHYQRDFIVRYYEHCWAKTRIKIESKKVEELLVPRSDIRRNMTKLERYINVVRHVQHHAAQLALTLQLLDGTETEWISWGIPRE